MFVSVDGMSNLAKLWESSVELFSQIQKSIFASSVFLLLMFWKDGGFDHDSPEYRAVEAAKRVISKTSGR
jgi:hypothetical protein